MAKATITLEDINEEDYSVNVDYAYTDEEADQALPGSVVASVIIHYLIRTNKLADFYVEAMMSLENGQVSDSE